MRPINPRRPRYWAFSFSRSPLTRALSSHSLPFVPQPRTLTPDGGDGGGCWCGCGSTAPVAPHVGTCSSRRPAAVTVDERLGGERGGATAVWFIFERAGYSFPSYPPPCSSLWPSSSSGPSARRCSTGMVIVLRNSSFIFCFGNS